MRRSSAYGGIILVRVERMKTCTYPGCARPLKARYLCLRHYNQQRYRGQLPPLMKRPRNSPEHLKSGTTAYAQWWKIANRERHLAMKRKHNKIRALERRAHRGKDRSERARERLENIRRLAAEGWGTRRIADELQLPRSTVWAAAARHGVVLKDDRGDGMYKATHQARSFLKRALRTPKWVDAEAIVEVYLACAKRRAAGEDVVVDHIVPLVGEKVSGLHVPWNLQLIRREVNELKGNRHLVLAEFL